MILTKAYDVEILPNFFSIVIVDLNDYLKVFADCHDGSSKQRPIPLTAKYTVEEIKRKLDKVEKKKFWISDTDDSQLLPMLGYISNMRPYKNDKGVAIRTDMFGYNSNKYDRLMVAGLLMFAGQSDTTKELITKLYELSKKIISLQDDKENYRKDYLISLLNKFNMPYIDIDVMSIFALNKVGKGVDKKTGETIYFPKSLKQTSINLQWYELLEHELPDIGEDDIHYYHKIDRYRGINADGLNKLIDKWDRYMLPKWIDDVMKYNTNDVYIVCEMVRLYLDEIRLRYNITKSYGVDVLSSSRSKIADKLFEKFYSEFSNLPPEAWRGRKTERTQMAFRKIIFPEIKFKTQQMQEFLEEIKKVVVTGIGKSAFLKEITINKLVYTMATGGIHSQDIPRELKSKIKDAPPSTSKLTASHSIWDSITDDSYIYVHADVASFYPSLIVEYGIAPAHIDRSVFVRLVKWLRDTRVAAKHSEEDYIDGIPKDLLAQVLKIVINSIYGKLGYEYGDICDKMAVLKVTINGQLFLLMLCEELEMNGLEVVSANTDGIVIKVKKDKKGIYDEIVKRWQEYTRLGLDSEEYKCYINRDINNYVVQELNDKVTYKGVMNPYMFMADLSKGYDMPIVAKAVSNYFLENKPILETLYECDNILDFCKTQNVGRQYHIEFTDAKGTIKLQRNMRFYVSTKGGYVEKVSGEFRSGLCARQQVTVLNTLDDKSINSRNINYSYYLNECMKIIDPIKLRVSPNLKGNRDKMQLSGKAIIKKNSGFYGDLFEDA